MSKLLSKKQGFSLIEMLIYVAILVLLLAVITGLLFSIMNSQKDIKVSRAIESSAISALDRMTREIRGAEDAVVSEEGLVLTRDGEIVEFYVNAEGVLEISEEGVAGPLTKSDTHVLFLDFSVSEAGPSKAVKIVMEITSGIGEHERTETFYNTVVLR